MCCSFLVTSQNVNIISQFRETWTETVKLACKQTAVETLTDAVQMDWTFPRLHSGSFGGM